METTDRSTTPAHGSRRVECCREEACNSGLRNNYFEGKRLTPHSFRLEQRYGMERRHLLNRAIHGWGVVYGYAVASGDPEAGTAGQLKIGPGLALDALGRELLQAGELWLKYDALIVLDQNGQVIQPAGIPPASDDPWLLSVHYAERADEPVDVSDRCHCRHHEWDRTCETVRYSLRPNPGSQDGALECHCGPPQDGPAPRGGRRCLCDHLAGLAEQLPTPAEERERLCEVEESCARVRVDLRHGVPVALVSVSEGKCGPVLGLEEMCAPRRLVKRNDLLFDLIVGRDLTRIERIGWEGWHRKEGAVHFLDFCRAFLNEPISDQERRYVTSGFSVQFTRPVPVTLLSRPDWFAMTALIVEREGGWCQSMRVPILQGEPTNFADSNHAFGVRVAVDARWLADALLGQRTYFYGPDDVQIEIEVRGDLILDCNGQAVDANGAGLAGAPPGNGTPGGTFLSTFRVAAATQEDLRQLSTWTIYSEGAAP